MANSGGSSALLAVGNDASTISAIAQGAWFACRSRGSEQARFIMNNYDKSLKSWRLSMERRLEAIDRSGSETSIVFSQTDGKGPTNVRFRPVSRRVNTVNHSDGEDGA